MKILSLFLLLAGSSSCLHFSTAVPTASSSSSLVHPSSSSSTKNHRSPLLSLEDSVVLQEDPSSQKVRGGAVVQQQQNPLVADLLHRLQIGFYFGLWYALNIIYNSMFHSFYCNNVAAESQSVSLIYSLTHFLLLHTVINKKILNICPAPLTIGSIQLGIGAAYIALLWLTKLRPMPVLTDTGRQALRQVGLWHATGQLASMVSLGAGAISFTHSEWFYGRW